MRLVCGIDVSKDTLDLHYNTIQGKEVSLRVKYNEKGHQKVLEVCGQRTYLIEASGPYYLKLAGFLKEAGCDVRVENPMRIRRFIQMAWSATRTTRRMPAGSIVTLRSAKARCGSCHRKRPLNAALSALPLICLPDRRHSSPISCIVSNNCLAITASLRVD
jgi:transposase